MKVSFFRQRIKESFFEVAHLRNDLERDFQPSITKSFCDCAMPFSTINGSKYQPSKAELRRSLLKTRQSMSVEEWREKSDRIVTHLQASPLFASAKTILAYFSFRQEPDLSSLFTNTDQRWGFPRCVGDSLIWHIWKPSDSLQTEAYGILEPHPNAPTLQPTEVDLIFVPAVACDYQGYRLGYGGGYYDRLFSSSEWATSPKIGIVFEFAYLQQLPTEPWDQQVHDVCTENSLKMR